MASNTFLIGAIAALIVGLLTYGIVTLRSYRSAGDPDGYLYARKPLNSGAVAGTIFASGMSFATVLVSLIQLGYIFGIALLWATVTYAVGWLVLFLLASRIRMVSDSKETLHGFLGRKFSLGRIAKISSLATIVGYVGSFAIEMFAIELVVNSLFGEHINSMYFIIFLTAFVIAYSAYGGFQAIVQTDKIQSIFIVLSIAAILTICIGLRVEAGLPDWFDQKSLSNFSLPANLVVSLAAINILFPLVDMSAWQRVQASESTRSFRTGGWVATVGFTILWATLILAAISLVGVVPDGEDPFNFLFSQSVKIEGVYGLAAGFVLIFGFIAAMLSTADTFLNAATTTFSLDLRPQASDVSANKSIRNYRRNIVFLGIAGFVVIAVLRSVGFGIVPLIFALYGGTLALLPTVLMAMSSLSSETRFRLRHWALWSIVIGFSASWMVGLHGVTCGDSDASLCKIANSQIAPDPYSAPLYALGIATVMVLAGLLSSTPRRSQNDDK